MNPKSEYHHTQSAPLSVLLVLVSVAVAGLAWVLRDLPQALLISGFVSCLLLFVAGCFHRLTVNGEASVLQLRFGPIPLFQKQIPYASMKSVEASRSSFIDGWGIHFVPGRGWTYNLWGRDCVLIRRQDNSLLRVGTDDVDGLLTFLRSQVQ